MQDYIVFPKKEYDDYIKRLTNNKVIYTTRVSSEMGKYKMNGIYKSDFGDLKVVFLKHYSKLSNHPFYNELNENQICEINKYIKENEYDVIGLIKV